MGKSLFFSAPWILSAMIEEAFYPLSMMNDMLNCENAK